MLVLLQQYAQQEHYEEGEIFETTTRLRLVNTGDLDYYCVFESCNDNDQPSTDLPFIIPMGETEAIDLTTTLSFRYSRPSSRSHHPRTAFTVGKLLFYKYNIMRNRELIDMRDPDFEEPVLCVLKLPAETPLHYDVYTVDEVAPRHINNCRLNRPRFS